MNYALELSWFTKISFEIIENWYNILFQTIDDLGISWRNIYNYDKSRFEIDKTKIICIIINIEIK